MKPTFNNEGLLPVIVQDYNTNQVLMLAYMNDEAYKQTIETNTLTFYSRSRKSLWVKGETSGNTQTLKKLDYDCDQDTLLAQVIQEGPACHTGNQSCFYRTLIDDANPTIKLDALYQVILDKKQNKDKGYTNYLFEEGVDKILKKIAEEAGEVIIASKNNNEETIYELSDLFYHSLVLMVNQGISLESIYKELGKRRQ
jgi:phosphoribosyl-ATP pyrophosphohydrolase/phosphoribosyl-AMP cyclohydrolase